MSETPHFIEPGDPEDVEPTELPLFVTKATLSELFDIQPGDTLEQVLSKPIVTPQGRTLTREQEDQITALSIAKATTILPGEDVDFVPCE